MRDEVARRRAGRGGHDLVGHAGRSTSAPASAPSSSAAGVEVVDASRCTREDDDLYSYRRDGARGRAARRAGPSAPGVGDVSARATRSPAGLAAVRRSGSPPPARARAATPDEVTLVVVTKFFPASDVRLLADLGVTDVGENRHQEAEAKARRVRATSASPGTSSAACRATRRLPSRRTPTWWTPSTGPSWCGGLDRGAHERDRAVDVLSRSASTRPRRAGARRGADPDELPTLADAGRRRRSAAAARR